MILSRPSSLSTVSETLTSDVAIKSTLLWWRAKISNNFARYPFASSILVERTLTSVTPFLAAMPLILPFSLLSATMMVPVLLGLYVLSTLTGMFLSKAGWMLFGCITFAPNVASSAASWKLMLSMVFADGTTLGSVESMPLTSVQIWISSASRAAPMSEAVKSEP